MFARPLGADSPELSSVEEIDASEVHELTPAELREEDARAEANDAFKAAAKFVRDNRVFGKEWGDLAKEHTDFAPLYETYLRTTKLADAMESSREAHGKIHALDSRWEETGARLKELNKSPEKNQIVVEKLQAELIRLGMARDQQYALADQSDDEIAEMNAAMALDDALESGAKDFDKRFAQEMKAGAQEKQLDALLREREEIVERLQSEYGITLNPAHGKMRQMIEVKIAMSRLTKEGQREAKAALADLKSLDDKIDAQESSAYAGAAMRALGQKESPRAKAVAAANKRREGVMERLSAGLYRVGVF